MLGEPQDKETPRVKAAELKDTGYTRTKADLPPGASSITTSSTAASDTKLEDHTKRATENIRSETWLLQRAQEIFTASSSYIEANITNTWNTNLAHFNGDHSSDARLAGKNYKRSRVFRPKTRSMVKKSETAFTVAAFSTKDYVNIEPQDSSDEVQRVSAQINKNILQHRLDDRMPWFLTAVGAYQDTKVYGICASHNYWRYEADTKYVLAFNDDGSVVTDDQGNAMGKAEPIVRKDDMCCDLIEPENIRFDPMCDWRDPANSSPYIVYMMPIYVGDALERMQNPNPKTGESAWIEHSMPALLATRGENYDRTRQAREGRSRVDPADVNTGNEFSMLWAHMNIVKIDGEDFVYWTMGTELLLSKPQPLQKLYPHLPRGVRPFTIGFSSIEAHKNYPASDVEQMSGLQTEINTVANQRLDNVKLVLNKRYYVRRGSQVDLNALVRNVPGGGVMMNDPERDIKTVDTRDVTGSSYTEQDRLSVEADELTGHFSQGSVQSNKNLNETVGGMGMMQQDSGAVGDYSIRVFLETWMEPTIRQFIKMIQYYETDETILAIAAKQTDLWQKYGIDTVIDQLLQQDLTVKVDIGMGMTDPVRRVERLLYAVEKTASLPGMVEKMKAPDITKEIFATLGYRDGERFYMSEEEFTRWKEEQGEQGPPPEIALKQQELEIRQEDNTLRHEREMEKLKMQAQLGYAKLAIDKQLKLDELFTQLGVEAEKIQTTRDVSALSQQTKIAELALARKTGKGI